MSIVDFSKLSGDEIAVLRFHKELEYNQLQAEYTRRVNGYTPPEAESANPVAPSVAEVVVTEPAPIVENNPMNRICEHCKKQFVQKHSTGGGKYIQKFCSVSCSNITKAYHSKNTAPNATCKECGGDMPKNLNPARIFCSARCDNAYHKKLNDRIKSNPHSPKKGTPLTQAPLPESPTTPIVGEYSHRHLVIFELLQISGVSISPKGDYIFSGEIYSSKSNFDILAALVPIGAKGSARRVNVVNKHIKTLLGATIKDARIGAVYGSRVLQIQKDMLTEHDKMIVREIGRIRAAMQAR